MRSITLAALGALLLAGCIQSRRTADDPERDAAVDAIVDDAAQLDDAAPLPPDPGPGPRPDCDAAPVCPPGYDRVDQCERGGICETITECGESILCQICPPGIGFFCDPGTYEVPECTNDATCHEVVDCAGRISCESCSVCPEGMIEVQACPPDVACHQCPAGDGDAIHPICAPVEAARCPPHTRQVDGCLPDDPLCWVLEDGSTCQSEICPVGEPCGSRNARAVDACRDDSLGCYERALCGEVVICEVLAHDCDDCAPSCPLAFSPVQRCVPDGRACAYAVACCTDVFCQADE